MKMIAPFWRLNACFIELNDWCTKLLEQLLKLNLLICKLKYTFKGWQLPKMQKYIPDLPLP